MPLRIQGKFKFSTLLKYFLILLLNYELQKESVGDGKCPAGFSVSFVDFTFAILQKLKLLYS